jgi:flagellar hook-associated protein 3 FlgL
MTRISSLSQQQLLVSRLLMNKESIAKYQDQTATGLKSPDLKGLARESNVLLSSKASQSRLESYMQSNRELQTRLEIQNTALGSIAGIADDLRQDLIGAVNLNSSVGFITKVEDHLDRLINLLTTSHGGKYVFGGTRTEQEPINVNNAADLLALAQTSDAFDNNSLKPTQLVDDGHNLEFGQLASDIAQPLLDSIRRILQFHNGTLPTGAGAYAPAGAFQDPLTANQRDFLISEFANANTAIATARDAEATNGVDLGTVDKLLERQTEDLTFLRGFISDIENVDIAEAVSNLKAGETALTASVQVLARFSQISLLNFL